MEIKFIITKKDYWNYNRYSILNVPKIRRIFLATPILIFVLTMSAGLIFKLDMRIISLVAVGVPVFYILTIYLPMMYSIMKIPQDKLVEHIIVIDKQKKQIIQTIDGKSNKFSAKNIQLVKNTKNYVYITTHGFRGIIIPGGPGYSLSEVRSMIDQYILA